MPQPGRNDPCPCGSGRKYKNCCHARQRDEQNARAARDSAVGMALDFLAEKYSAEVERATRDGFFRSLGDEEMDRLAELPDSTQEVIFGNAREWALFDGVLEVGGEARPALELVLAPGGPLLLAEGRRWLEAVASQAIAVYEVVESRPGEGLVLRDLLRKSAQPFAVREESASRQLVRWDVIAARVVPWNGGAELSVAYALERADVEAIREGLRDAQAEFGRRREVREAAVAPIAIDLWLRRWVRALEPTIIDAATGAPSLLVTDHFDVVDWETLVARLAAQADIEGDREHGWSRVEGVPADGLRRSLLAINPRADGRLELFARSLPAADSGRSWFAGVAGETVRFRIREQVDPLAALRERRRSPSPARTVPEVPLTSELREQLYQHIYRDWLDQPVPALGGKTPRQAVRSSGGRRQVVDLLKSYEANEVHAAQREGREPTSFDFLWRQLDVPPAQSPG